MTHIRGTVIAAALAGALSMAAGAQAQPAAPSSPWSAEVALGWDNSISGNINSSGIGELNDQVVVVARNSYDNVYGTGLHFRFGGGYLLNENLEARASFTFQSLDADYVSPMGDIGVSKLYAQYTDYQAFTLDVGLRRYGRLSESVQAYGEGSIGLGFIDETDVTLVAPSINFTGTATDFYDQTAAFTMGFAAGLMVKTSERISVFGQLGLRWVSGMAEIDNLAATGLENINDNSSRWTLPFVGGVRVRF